MDRFLEQFWNSIQFRNEWKWLFYDHWLLIFRNQQEKSNLKFICLVRIDHQVNCCLFISSPDPAGFDFGQISFAHRLVNSWPFWLILVDLELHLGCCYLYAFCFPHIAYCLAFFWPFCWPIRLYICWCAQYGLSLLISHYYLILIVYLLPFLVN